jgi:hypothetical protein
MSEPAISPDEDDLDFLDTPMTVKDWCEVLEDDIDQAVDDLNENEIEELISFLRRKLYDIEVPF